MEIAVGANQLQALGALGATVGCRTWWSIAGNLPMLTIDGVGSDRAAPAPAAVATLTPPEPQQAPPRPPTVA